MKWGSSVIASANVADALARAAARVREQLGRDTADLALLFVSHHFRDAFPRMPSLLQEHLPTGVLVGCSAGGVIGGGEEVENQPAVSVTAAHLPGVKVHALYTDTQDLPDADAAPEVWRAWLGLRALPRARFVVLADPLTSAMDPFLTGLDYAFPASPKIGGLASGGRRAGEHALFVQDQVHTSGLVTLALSGNVEMDTIVAQGCRPIGRPLTVTRCNHNLLVEVDRVAPLKYLARLVEELGEYDRQLMRTSLFLGVEPEPTETTPEPAEYLIRNLVGIDYSQGVLAVGSHLREGQLVQFHLRDKVTSAEDLERLLERYSEREPALRPAGALLFSCMGRGRLLYGEANHDSRRFAERMGEIPLGGFFCNGEIGPVTRTTYVHGYTSSFGLFRSATPGDAGTAG